MVGTSNESVPEMAIYHSFWNLSLPPPGTQSLFPSVSGSAFNARARLVSGPGPRFSHQGWGVDLDRKTMSTCRHMCMCIYVHIITYACVQMCVYIYYTEYIIYHYIIYIYITSKIILPTSYDAMISCSKTKSPWNGLKTPVTKQVLKLTSGMLSQLQSST